MHWQAALELMEKRGTNPEQRARLLKGLGRCSFEIDPIKSVNYRESAIALYEGIGSLEKAAHLRITLGRS